MCCHFFRVGTLPSLSLSLSSCLFYGRSTLLAIPLDSGSLYCLTSFSPSSLSLGPWQLLSQCFAPRDSGRGGWVGKREREKWNGGKNGRRRIDRDWFLGWRDTLWQLLGKSLTGIRQRDKCKQMKETEIWQNGRSSVGSAFAQWRNVRLWGCPVCPDDYSYLSALSVC